MVCVTKNDLTVNNLLETVMSNLDEVFLQACKNGDTEVVKHLSLDPRVDVAALNNEGFVWACRSGNIEVVKHLCLDPPSVGGFPPLRGGRVEVAARNNEGFTEVSDLGPPFATRRRWACYRGHIEVVKYLSLDPRVDVAAQNNQGFRYACYGGHIEVVKYLSSNPRVDVASQNNCGFIWACEHGHIEVVKVFEFRSESRRCSSKQQRFCTGL